MNAYDVYEETMTFLPDTCVCNLFILQWKKVKESLARKCTDEMHMNIPARAQTGETM